MGMGCALSLPEDFEGTVLYVSGECSCGEPITVREGESFFCEKCGRHWELGPMGSGSNGARLANPTVDMTP